MFIICLPPKQVVRRHDILGNHSKSVCFILLRYFARWQLLCSNINKSLPQS